MVKKPSWVDDEFKWLDIQAEKAERKFKECERRLEKAFDEWRKAKQAMLATRKDVDDYLESEGI